MLNLLVNLSLTKPRIYTLVVGNQCNQLPRN